MQFRSWLAASAVIHEPGRLGASGFTSMNELSVTIQGQHFDHLIYHFVLTYPRKESVPRTFSQCGQYRISLSRIRENCSSLSMYVQGLRPSIEPNSACRLAIGVRSRH